MKTDLKTKNHIKLPNLNKKKAASIVFSYKVVTIR
jgi:hypothetical protein